MPYLTPDRILTALRKTPVVLDAVLRGVSQERAQAATDGPDGWSVVEVVCHLRDYEEIFYERVQLMLAQNNPKLPHYDQVALAKERRYASQNLREAFDDFRASRRKFIALFSGLDEEQLRRPGIHPNAGNIYVLELGMHVALHDLTHIEQIVHTLALSDLNVAQV